jgi:GNAT superfamily N-acetyltransferase
MSAGQDDITFHEFGSKPELIYHSSWLDDLNHLLPQVSKSAKPVDRARLEAMKQAGTKLYVAIHDSRIVGVVLLCRTELLVGTKDWIEDVVVDETYRGRGIAGKLMDMAEEYSRSTGAKHLNLTSSVNRGPARDMYLGRGYVIREESDLFRLNF